MLQCLTQLVPIFGISLLTMQCNVELVIYVSHFDCLINVLTIKTGKTTHYYVQFNMTESDSILWL